jgi:FkbM family methyltransferase
MPFVDRACPAYYASVSVGAPAGKPVESMALPSSFKRVMIGLGIYGPIRTVWRRIRPHRRAQNVAEVRFLRALVPPGSLCFDVGANVGNRSEPLLAAGARVVAFEPNPRVWPELTAPCGGRPDWTGVPAALGRQPAIEALREYQCHGLASLVPGWQDDVKGTQFVPVVTLDMAIGRFGRPYYVKIDVEGFEAEVLAGLSQAVPLVSFEFFTDVNGVPRARACVEHLLALGFDRFNVTAEEGTKFLLPRWRPLREFFGMFPDVLRAAMPGPPYGDLWVVGPGAEVADEPVGGTLAEVSSCAGVAADRG